MWMIYCHIYIYIYVLYGGFPLVAWKPLICGLL